MTHIKDWVTTVRLDCATMERPPEGWVGFWEKVNATTPDSEDVMDSTIKTATITVHYADGSTRSHTVTCDDVRNRMSTIISLYSMQEGVVGVEAHWGE